MTNKYLITGGCGFIGSCVIRNLLNNKDNVVANIDKLSYSSNTQVLSDIKYQENYTFYQEDICNKDSINEIINTFKPNKIIHLAAESHVDRSIDGPEVFMQSNILGTFNLIDSSYKFYSSLSHKLKNNFKFLLVSTDEVYGSLGIDENKFDENSNYKPNSPYSASKAASDHIARAWIKTFQMPILISNTTNNYGPWQFPEKLIPLTIYKCLNEKDIPIYGNGEQIRDWIYVDDHVNGLFYILENGTIGEKYNIGSNNEIKNIDVVSNICEILDQIRPREKGSYSDLITFVDDRPGHDTRYALNNKKICDLGWKPSYSWNTGLRQTIDWYLGNIDYLESKNIKKYSGERLGKI
mgnify:CR=1 FL=1